MSSIREKIIRISRESEEIESLNQIFELYDKTQNELK